MNDDIKCWWNYDFDRCCNCDKSSNLSCQRRAACWVNFYGITGERNNDVFERLIGNYELFD